MNFPPIDHEAAEKALSLKCFNEDKQSLRTYWGIAYDTLRRLCVDHPAHCSMDAVAAKVWIIGRTYSTQIERKVLSDKSQGSAMVQVVELLVRRGREIDALIGGIQESIPYSLRDEDIRSYVTAHGRFVKLMAAITYKNQSARSFVSKYLHFHRPIVPIYDSVASATLSRILPWKKAYDCDPLDEAEDASYRQYVMQLRQLNGAAVSSGLLPTVQELDWHLLCEATRQLPEKKKATVQPSGSKAS